MEYLDHPLPDLQCAALDDLGPQSASALQEILHARCHRIIQSVAGNTFLGTLKDHPQDENGQNIYDQ